MVGLTFREAVALAYIEEYLKRCSNADTLLLTRAASARVAALRATEAASSLVRNGHEVDALGVG